MSLFRSSLYGADPSFTPLFRLLDDFDSYSREVQGDHSNNEGHRRVQAVRTFNPKFDVRETESAYELHGELAGIDRDNVSIEFTEPQTMIIRGKIERQYTSGTSDNASSPSTSAQPHKVTVEEATDDGKEKTQGASTAVAKTSGDKAVSKAPAAKFWVSERSVGEFSRTFSFPTRVDQENVSANLNNGILSVVVPKAKKQGVHRVAIN